MVQASYPMADQRVDGPYLSGISQEDGIAMKPKKSGS